MNQGQKWASRGYRDLNLAVYVMEAYLAMNMMWNVEDFRFQSVQSR